MSGYSIDFDFSGSDTTYLTHSLHPYPAKFPPQLPRTVLKKYGSADMTVLDPFCGSGTTLVEARLLGFNAVGVDVNGLSTLLSKVKATPLTNCEIQEIKEFIKRVEAEQAKCAGEADRRLGALVPAQCGRGTNTSAQHDKCGRRC